MDIPRCSYMTVKALLYDVYLFGASSVSLVGCAGLMIFVTFITIFMNYLDKHRVGFSRKRANEFYAKLQYVIVFMDVLLIVVFCSGAVASLNLWFIKISNSNIQAMVSEVSVAFIILILLVLVSIIVATYYVRIDIKSKTGNNAPAYEVEVEDRVSTTEIVCEMNIIATVASILLIVVTTILAFVNRSEVAEAIEEDRSRCEAGEIKALSGDCTKSIAYDASLFPSAILSMEGCAAVLLLVFIMSLAMRFLHVRDRDETDEKKGKNVNVKSTIFYKWFHRIIQFQYILLLASFISISVTFGNLLMIKVGYPTLQTAVYGIAITYIIGFCVCGLWVIYNYILIVPTYYGDKYLYTQNKDDVTHFTWAAFKAWLFERSKLTILTRSWKNFEDISSELSLTLTIATLLLAGILVLVSSLTRAEVREAISIDQERCYAGITLRDTSGGCHTVVSYDSYVFVAGTVSAVGCAGAVLLILIISLLMDSAFKKDKEAVKVVARVARESRISQAIRSRSVLVSEEKEEDNSLMYKNVNSFYYRIKYVIYLLDAVLILSFVCGAVAGLHVMYIKINSLAVQLAVHRTTYAFIAVLVALFLWAMKNYYSVHRDINKHYTDKASDAKAAHEHTRVVSANGPPAFQATTHSPLAHTKSGRTTMALNLTKEMKSSDVPTNSVFNFSFMQWFKSSGSYKSSDEIIDEVYMLLTIASLLFIATFTIISAVSRGQVAQAIHDDRIACAASGSNCKVSVAYDSFVFVLGALSAQGCAIVLIMVLILSVFMYTLNIHSRTEDGLIRTSFFYDTFQHFIHVMNMILVWSFIAGLIAATNLWYIKVGSISLQRDLTYTACIDAGLIVLSALYGGYCFYNTYNSRIFKALRENKSLEEDTLRSLIPDDRQLEARVSLCWKLFCKK